jgi:threonine dehydratase
MVKLADIHAARQRIRDSIYFSPAPHSETLSRATGCSLYLKLENLQVTGSFKERGALNRILTMTPEERAAGVITASAGNHGQGLAYWAAKKGIRAQICMPVFAPITKVSAVSRYGAEAILHGINYDEAQEEALQRAQQNGLTFVHAFDDEAVIAGQGSIGLELLEQVPDLEAVVVPLGGGGLISGVACAIKELKPEVRVIGVQTERVPSMKVAMHEHQPVLVPAESTIADGIAVRKAGELTLPMCEKYVDDIVTVEEEEIATAMLRLLEIEKTVVEGAGAAGMAAVLEHRTETTGKNVAVIITGGNIDVMMISHIIQRGLVKDGRLVRVRVTLPDHPGALHKLAGLIGAENANIVQATHDRTYFGVGLGDTNVDLTIETRGPEHVNRLMERLTKAGYPLDRIL